MMRSICNMWIIFINSRLTQADKLLKYANIIAATGEKELIKQAGDLIARAEELINGRDEGEIKQQTKEEGIAIWESRYGKMDSDTIKEKLRKFSENSNAEAIRQAETNAKVAANKASRTRRRKIVRG